jgi:hypothetical protein
MEHARVEFIHGRNPARAQKEGGSLARRGANVAGAGIVGIIFIAPVADEGRRQLATFRPFVAEKDKERIGVGERN